MDKQSLLDYSLLFSKYIIRSSFRGIVAVQEKFRNVTDLSEYCQPNGIQAQRPMFPG